MEPHPELKPHQALPPYTRRGFIALTALAASCTQAPPLPKTPAPRRVTAPGTHQSPESGNAGSLSGPIPRNPNLALDSNFNRSAGITFTRVPVNGKFIALTFDDGPHPTNTPRLLNILRERNVKATFYVIGRSVNLYPQILRQTVAEGHEIGNHTQTHRLLSKLSDSEVLNELRRCRDSIAQASGATVRTMRPPYGGLLPRQREIVHAKFGYPTILWSVDPLDWKRPGVSVVSSRLIQGASDGGILLAHDIHAPTIDAMPATIDSLLRRGYQFVTVSQLIAMKSEASAANATATPTNS
ncbi:MAG: polysaccharide deacetylase family protein [Akkermansiaceae bacterium]|nr:polysaccharide deacetylase family protein [Akkermansiaceae bacterium]